MTQDPYRVADRLSQMKPSGIRKFFELGRSMKNPVDLSIGQADFDVPEQIQAAAVQAIQEGKNRYTVTQGVEPLREALKARYAAAIGERATADEEVIVTCGVSGGLSIAFLSLLDPGDEILVPDPYFVMYRHLATLVGATSVTYDTYPDFEIDVEKIRAKITDRTRAILVNSPSNPTGHAITEAEARALAKLADDTGILLISDEIYEDFVYESRHVSPREFTDKCIVLGGASKNMGMPGWRIGWMFGRKDFIERCYMVQQFTFVCAPAPAQWAALAGLEQDFTPFRESYRQKRDMVYAGLQEHYAMKRPGGAFYAFPRLPAGVDSQQFMDKCIKRELLVVPGSACSDRATNFRLSYAAKNDQLDKAIDMLNEIALELT